MPVGGEGWGLSADVPINRDYGGHAGCACPASDGSPDACLNIGHSTGHCFALFPEQSDCLFLQAKKGSKKALRLLMLLWKNYVGERPCRRPNSSRQVGTQTGRLHKPSLLFPSSFFTQNHQRPDFHLFRELFFTGINQDDGTSLPGEKIGFLPNFPVGFHPIGARLPCRLPAEGRAGRPPDACP